MFINKGSLHLLYLDDDLDFLELLLVLRFISGRLFTHQTTHNCSTLNTFSEIKLSIALPENIIISHIRLALKDVIMIFKI